MERDGTDRVKTFTRRALFVGLLQGSFLALLGWRLAWLQISQGDKYRTLSDKNRINIKMLSPVRGLIVDRHGKLMAENGQNFRVLLIPEQTDDMEKALSSLQKLITLSQHDIQKVLKQAEKSPKFAALEVKDNLDWDDVARVEVNLPDLPGLMIDVGEIRHYPMAKASAHLIGYVGAVSRSDMNGDPVMNLPGFKIGKTGLEKSYDADLRGKAGAAEVEVNVVGREVRELGRNPGLPGARVQLTIDAGLQDYVQRRLSQVRSASAVVMDVHSGAVYTLASSPAFDPNAFTRGLSPELWEELLADPALPLNNKAVGGQYPPGSTFKMVTAIAGLEEGVINRHTTAWCPGHYDYGDSRFHCWKRPGHGHVDIIDALAESCDTYFYKMATDLGIDRLAHYSKILGLGDKLGFELAEERPGLIPTQAWKRANFKEGWHPGESIVASIGQGYILATPLQLAVMTARLVNGGFAVKPWVTGMVGNKAVTHPEWPLMPINPLYLKMVNEGMARVVNHQKGTAYGARIKEEGMEMGGKTGTAQVRRITKQQRADGVKNSDLPWNQQHHALFVGYAPLAKPQYVTAVVVEHGGGGSAVAAPIARDILIETQRRNP
ncbi:MAG: penicillin-binding protein 2, partial [Alphaproteobacteria bacterium]|nr:penicillin-binding protein 2 [Alphaproteobacteria bacterium]